MAKVVHCGAERRPKSARFPNSLRARVRDMGGQRQAGAVVEVWQGRAGGVLQVCLQAGWSRRCDGASAHAGLSRGLDPLDGHV